MDHLMQDFETIDKINFEADAKQKLDLLYEMQRGLDERENTLFDPTVGGKLVADEIKGAVDEYTRQQDLQRSAYDDRNR